MKRKCFLNVLLLLVGVFAFSSASYANPVPTQTLSVNQVNEDGFGDSTNQYAWSMESFKGSLYVGTLNHTHATPGMELFFLGFPVKSNGTQIHKGTRDVDGTWAWEKILSDGNGNSDNYGIRKLKVIGDYMYGAVANHVDGFELWRTFDGVNWEVVVDKGLGNPDNTSGRGLSAHDGYLYLGVENRKSGAQIWRRAIADDGDFMENSEWEQVVSAGLGNTSNYWFSDFVEYNGWLYCGTLNLSGMELWRTADGVNFEKIFDKGNGVQSNTAAMKLYVYKDKLYVGTMNFIQGASLYVNTNTAGTRFEPLFTQGNGHRNNSYVWYMKAFNDRLYVGTFKSFGEFDLFSAKDPGMNDWTAETIDAFGNAGQYGIRTMAVYQDKLMIGTATAKNDEACKIFEATPRESYQ
ncbi:MAG: hypothetical protein GY710_21580 [Desulfobacteraceae bacterium]|nr:hypothetical protein [Desulfobacteraceae bacterium]